MDKSYVQGFMDKCAEMGVDPEVLVKQSFGPAPTDYSQIGMGGPKPIDFSQYGMGGQKPIGAPPGPQGMLRSPSGPQGMLRSPSAAMKKFQRMFKRTGPKKINTPPMQLA